MEVFVPQEQSVSAQFQGSNLTRGHGRAFARMSSVAESDLNGSVRRVRETLGPAPYRFATSQFDESCLKPRMVPGIPSTTESARTSLTPASRTQGIEYVQLRPSGFRSNATVNLWPPAPPWSNTNSRLNVPSENTQTISPRRFFLGVPIVDVPPRTGPTRLPPFGKIAVF
jgi:hypothetical protein